MATVTIEPLGWAFFGVPIGDDPPYTDFSEEPLDGYIPIFTADALAQARAEGKAEGMREGMRGGVKVKALVWSQSMVFGSMKRRGSSPFGEVAAFTVKGLSADEIERKEAIAQDEYDKQILSALALPSPPADGETKPEPNEFEQDDLYDQRRQDESWAKP